MATQSTTRLSLLLLASLVSVASPAALRLASSLGNTDGDGDALNLMGADLREEDASDLELLISKLTPPDGDFDADVSEELSVPTPGLSDAVKPKGSTIAKKPVLDVFKHAKDELDGKMAPSPRLEPPVEDEQVLEHVLGVVRRIIEVAGKAIAVKLAEPSPSPTTTTTTPSPTTPSPPSEDDSLPRLSPPIWSPSSEAEAISDALRLPLVEPYDRYDRYSHSIARDVVW